MESDTESKDSMVSNFCNITGVDAARSQFYLESANWNLQLAIQSFFEHSAEDIEMNASAPELPANEERNRPEQLPPLSAIPPIVDTNSSDDEMSSPLMSKPKNQQKPKSSSKPQSSSKFATIDSLKRQTDSGGSSEEEGQAFYTGGSQHSGQQILGPKKKNTDELVSNMFKSAKEHGAEAVDPNEDIQRKKKLNSFVGTGFKLGSTSQPSLPVENLASSSTQRPQNVEMVLKLWRNGFSLDDGPLRDYNDPQNNEFLTSIRRGEIPRELIQKTGKEVHLNMEDHKAEEFVASKRPVQVFSGEGHRLGNPSADLITTTAAVEQNTDPKANEATALKNLKVDESQPTTSIQIRLSDGSRLVLKVNFTHTIAHIRQYICESRPIYSTQTFQLMTTFPNRELTEESLTIKDANLANASIVQRLK